jgi:carboxy-cis,cis-muconate cyclase
MMSTFHFLVGSFNRSEIYTCALTVGRERTARLEVVHRSPAQAPHSWLHVSDDKRFLYATSWTEPPGLAAYAVHAPHELALINSVRTASRSGYVCASGRAVYSAGGPSGEVFAIDPGTGGFQESADGRKSPLQRLSFVQDERQQDDGSELDFGGLRHGAHSADLSPDGTALYVADIGRNAIFTFAVHPGGDGRLTTPGQKHAAPRRHDGPRHVWPHPGGRHVYCVQEHSSMVDVFEVVAAAAAAPGPPQLAHVQGVKIIPPAEDCTRFWADEVRTSRADGSRPKYLYSSTRGLAKTTMGYVAAFRLREDGRIDDDASNESNGGPGEQDGLLAMWQTPTSGGWANAIQPGPTVDGIEYIALTDSDDGLVMVLSWDGREFNEAARVTLGPGVTAATAVWL